MITAIIGKPGTGKTLQMVRFAEKFLKKGQDVYSNILLDQSKMNLGKKPGRLFFWQDIEQFKYIHEGVILWDEVGAYFDSRAYAKFPEDVRIKLQQSRKDGLNLFYTVQAYSRADLILKQLTNFLLECHSIFNIFWVTEYFPEEYEKPMNAKHRGTFFYLGTKKLYSYYNTKQKIGQHFGLDYQFPLMTEKLKELSEPVYRKEVIANEV